jgi:hypothetical protein
MQQLNYSKETGCFYVVRAETRARDKISWEFCTGGSEEETWAHEAEEFPLPEAVVRERQANS